MQWEQGMLLHLSCSFPDREDIFLFIVVVFSCTSVLSSLCFGSQVFELVGNMCSLETFLT